MTDSTAVQSGRSGVSRETFRELAASLGFLMKPQDEADYYELMREAEAEVLEVDALPAYEDPRLAPTGVPVAERRFWVPSKEDNPLNAWSHRTELCDKRSKGGLLAGRSVAVKDTVSVAGVPLTLGTQAGHLTATADAAYPVPTIDAPVVARVLAAGGVIRGTSTCENYCMSGLSCSSATGPVDNPWLPGYSAGGSSSGSAALVAVASVRAWRRRRGLPEEGEGVGRLGEGVDLALGGDQGGSIRLPAAFSGIYGLKPTHGLVPYTGIGSLHPMVDHVGPMAASIEGVALLLRVVAGADDIDPRATPRTPLPEAVPAYDELLAAAISKRRAAGTWTPTAAGRGLRVGLLKEALELPELDPAVAAVVRAAAEQFRKLGAEVKDVSAPLHRLGSAIWTAAVRGTAGDVFVGNRAPDLVSYTMPELAPAYPQPGQAWYDTLTASAPTVVNGLLVSAYLGDARRFGPRFRNKAVMHVTQLRAAYDALLAEVDVLLLPVTPCVGPPHAETLSAAGVLDKHHSLLGVSGNTGPFNVTGHPALAIPGGWAPVTDGGPGKLPVGIQLVGRHHDEVGLLLAASIWEVGGAGLDKED